MESTHQNTVLFYDEEDVLPLELFVAELDLVTSAALQKRPTDSKHERSNNMEWSKSKSQIDLQKALLEVLPKIAATIQKSAASDVGSFQPMQKSIESIFLTLIKNGLPPPILRLLLVCLDKIYTHGDLSSLFSLVTDLHKIATARKEMSELGLLSVIDCLAHLSLKHGHFTAASSLSTLSLIKSLLTSTLRSSPVNDRLRSRALHLLTCLCEGIPPSDRCSPQIHNEAWLVFTRSHMDQSHGDEARIMCIAILRALARSRSSTLWLDGGARFNEAVKASMTALTALASSAQSSHNDTSLSGLSQFMDQYCLVLSDLALAAHPCLDLPRIHGTIDSRSAAVKKQAAMSLEGVRRNAVSSCLSSPLITFSAAPGGRIICVSLATAFVSYLSSLLALRQDSDTQQEIERSLGSLDDEMIDLGMTLVLIGTAASVAHKASSPMVLSGGEMPLIESSCIYVLKEMISSSSAHASRPGSLLGERWRRKFLTQLSTMLSPGGEALSWKGGESAPLSPPSIVIALKAISMLLEASGELLEDAWEKNVDSNDMEASQTPSITFDPRAIESAVATQSSHLSSSVRNQAALTFESLALASPSSCARMLSSALIALTGASTVLAASSSSSNSASTPLSADIIDRPDLTSSAMGPFTVLPTFPLSPPSSSHPIPIHTTTHTICSQSSHVHGLALSVSSLLSIASKLPLGCPSILFLNALSLSSKLALRPRSMGINERAIEVEAGLTLAGALCLDSCLNQDGPMEGRLGQIMGIVDHTLGGDEAGEIDVLATRLAIHEAQLSHLFKSKAKGDLISTQTASLVVSSIMEELCMKLWTQSAALRCLPTLIYHLLSQGDQDDVLDHLTSLLSTLLGSLGDFIPGHTSILHDIKASSGLLNACVITFQMRLLSAFLALPPSQWSKMDPRTLELLLNLAANNTTLKSEATDEMMAYKEASDAIYRTILPLALSSSDAILGPYPTCPAGKDGYEDELRSFTGAAGGPHLLPWEIFTRPPYDLSPQSSTLYPQPLSLSATLLSRNICVLSRLIAHVPAPACCSELETPVVKISVADRSLQFVLDLSNSFKNTLATITDVRIKGLASVHRRSCCVVASSVALIGLKLISQGSHPPLSAHACEQIVAVANSVLDQTNDVLLSRSASELFAYAGCLSGSDSWRHSVHSGLINELARESKHTLQIPAVALALGSLHKKTGGISMRSLFTPAFDSLLSSCESALVQIRGPYNLNSKDLLPIIKGLSWSLHSLNLLASSSSSCFTSNHVDKAISLCCHIMVSGIDAKSCSSTLSSEEFMLGQHVSRLANALIAALGPEFILGSNPYRWTRAILAGEMNSLGGIESLVKSWAGKRDDSTHLSDPIMSRAATAYGLEAVGFVQQLSLFSPLALSRSASNRHLPLLRQAILSPLPGLRRAGVTTLRTLAERELAESKAGVSPLIGSHSLVAEEMELELIHAFDSEDDNQSSSQIQQALLALMKARPNSCEARNRWMGLLASVALAQDHAAALPSNHQSAHVDKDKDEEGVETSESRQQPTSPPPAPSRPLSSLRLSTRLMAAKMICLLLSSDHHNLDPSPHSTADFIHQLIDIGFKAATGPTLALRPIGIELLRQVVLKYSKFPDPLFPEGHLLTQFQAQIVSALRSSLTTSSLSPISTTTRTFDPNPLISAAGMSLATTFLESQICSSDIIVMRRLMDLLCSPLQQWSQGNVPGAELELKYGEWVGIEYRVGLLRAHAQCFHLSLSSEVVQTAQAPFKLLLRDLWTSLVVDTTLLSSPPDHPEGSFPGYKSQLIIEPKALACLSSIPSLAPLVRRKGSKGGVDPDQDEADRGDDSNDTASLGVTPSIPQSALDSYHDAFPDTLKSLSLLIVESTSVNDLETEIDHSAWFRALSSSFYSLGDVCICLKRSLQGDYSSSRHKLGSSFFQAGRAANGLQGKTRATAEMTEGQIKRLTCLLTAIDRLLSLEGLLQSAPVWASVQPVCLQACDWVVSVINCLTPFLSSLDHSTHSHFLSSLLSPLQASADILRHIAQGCSPRSFDDPVMIDGLLRALVAMADHIFYRSYSPLLTSSVLDAALSLVKTSGPQPTFHLPSLLCLGLKPLLGLEEGFTADPKVIEVATSYLSSAVISAHERSMTDNVQLTEDESEAVDNTIAAVVIEMVDLVTRIKSNNNNVVILSRLVSSVLHLSSFTSVEAARKMTIDLCLGLIHSNEAYQAQSLVMGLSDFLSTSHCSSKQTLCWKKQVISLLCPPVAVLSRRGLRSASPFQSSVLHGVSCLVHAFTIQESCQEGMLIVVSLLIEASEQEALKETAIKILSSFPSHPILASSFAESLKQLPVSVKTRLLSAVKEAAMPRKEEQMQTSEADGARSNKFPSSSINRTLQPIQLKKFI